MCIVKNQSKDLQSELFELQKLGQNLFSKHDVLKNTVFNHKNVAPRWRETNTCFSLDLETMSTIECVKHGFVPIPSDHESRNVWY